jgi:hypothetical protein
MQDRAEGAPFDTAQDERKESGAAAAAGDAVSTGISQGRLT